jgi:hypothetical protein
MPRIIVTTNSEPIDALVLLDENVQSVHLSTGHAASQLVERLAWAISDAEDVEVKQGRSADRPASLERGRARRRQSRRAAAARPTELASSA